MKKAISALLTAAVAFVLCFFVACGGNTQTEKDLAESVTLNRTELRLKEGEQALLKAYVLPIKATDNDTLWKSEDESIATVDGGIVTAEKAGETTVTVTVDDQTAVCTVYVSEKSVDVSYIKLNKFTVEMQAGDSETLTAVVLPDNATASSVVWASDNEDVVTVDGGVLTAKKAGRAIISAACGGKTAFCSVTVKTKQIEVTEISLNKTETELVAGESEKLSVTFNPSDATDKSAVWVSDNPAVASVSEGTIYARKAGSAVITVTAGGKTVSCTVTVKAKPVAVEGITLDIVRLEIIEGGEEILTAFVMPENATDKTVVWSTSDESIAAVENGVVTALKPGKAVITATAGEKSAVCEVTVIKKVIPVYSVTVNTALLELTEGGEETLTAVVMPENATDKTVVWSTSDESVAAVENGVVTALKPGKAVITATAGGQKAEVTVTVKAAYVAVSEIKVSKTALILGEGTSERVIASILPENATQQQLKWSSANTTVATVRDGIISGRKVGETVITVSADGVKTEIKVTVQAKFVAVTSVTLNKTSLELTEGDDEILSAAVMPVNATDKTVTWESSDEDVVSVENGVIVAKKGGRAVITATAGNKSANCTVTVKTRFVPVSEITLDKSYIELTEGDEETLTAVVMPENATDKTVVWSTSDESVAAVENGVITALKPGKAVITATAGAVSASCTVEVKERYYEVTSVELDKTTLEIRIGGTYTFTATILPENASNKTLVWESSDEDVLTVNGGTVTPVGVGKATVTVKAADGKSAVCEVTVKEKYIEVTEIKLSRSTLSMKGGAVRTLTATVMPENATDKTVVWSTSDESVAAVENGVVTALKPGKAVITATVGNKNATCTVTVLSDETHQEGYLWYEDFNGTVVPNYLRQQVEGTGAVTMTGTGMSLALSGNGKAFANYDFAKAPAGIVVIDVRMMATSNIFNGLFIYSSNNQPVISIAMDQGNIRNNSGRGWTTAAGALVQPFELNRYYDLRLVINTGSAAGTFDLYVDGTAYKGLKMRTPAEADSIGYIRFGSENAGSGSVIDYAYVRENVPAPSITVNENYAEIDITVNADYQFKYTAASNVDDEVQISITCDKDTGFTLDGNNVTFSSAGEYLFTITASDYAGTIASTVRVNVTGLLLAPSLDVTSELNSELSLQSASGAVYTLTYTADGSPVPAMTFDWNKTPGRGTFAFDPETGIATFFTAGKYILTVTAENSVGSDEKTITINVTDKYAKPAEVNQLYSADFNDGVIPADLSLTKGGAGSAVVEDGKLHITTGSGTTEKIFVDKNFDAPLSGIVVTEQTFSYNHDFEADHFTNLMFMVGKGGTGNAVACFSVVQGELYYHAGGWKVFQYFGSSVRFVRNEVYTLRIVNDMENKISYVYVSGTKLELVVNRVATELPLDGEIYLGAVAFRTPQTPVYVIRTGGDKTGLDYSIDKFDVYSLTGSLGVTAESEKLYVGDSTQYTLKYETDSDVEVTCDKADGFTLGADKKTVTFTKSGTYKFTFTLKNDVYGDIVRTIMVNALPETLFATDFTSEPGEADGVTITKSGTGSYAYDAANKNMTISMGTTSGSIFWNKKFDEPMFGEITITEGITNHSAANGTFANIMFLNDTAGTTVQCFAIETGRLRYHSGGWKTVQISGKDVYLKLDVRYVIRAVHDMTAKKTKLYLSGNAVMLGSLTGEEYSYDGELYLGEFNFRNPDKAAQVLSLATNKTNTSYSVDSITVTGKNQTL